MSNTNIKSPVFEYVENNPKVLDAHANWLASGGANVLNSMVDSVRGELWPWDREPHVQASFGAFCAGVSWASKLLKDLVVLAREKEKAVDLLAAAHDPEAEQIQKMLISNFGFTADDFKPTSKKKGSK